ncbi:hypothetical protein MACJ_000371 [Theileria orientalis]|uniref:Endonuclease/exonuclease/phosphatase domain-containing protein n=1 Tax=Theileria orientalis TaxID=68886 RepID=A0A976M3Y7_THEOR|nr:hypothetical protein MACJ_000371 [Theileria orientalis]
MSPACVMQSVNPKLPNEFINENKIENHNSSLSKNNTGITTNIGFDTDNIGISKNDLVIDNHGVNSLMMRSNHGIDSNHGMKVNLHTRATHVLMEDADQSSVKQPVQESATMANELSPSEDSQLTRYWYYPQTKPPKHESMDFKSFQVMTFNTLAQSLVDHKYVENDQTTMSWTKRRHEIYKVIQESGCDIVCLQEIDELDYTNFFKEKVEDLGYESVYKRKLQNRLDGVLTLYKRDRYELVMKRELNFSSEQEEYDKPQVALIVVLRDLYTTANKFAGDSTDGRLSCGTDVDSASSGAVDDILIVANTHLIFNKSRGDIKLYQLCRLLAGLKQTYDEVMHNASNNGATSSDGAASAAFATNTSTTGGTLLPNVLLCGDLNLTPQSLMYNFLFHGFAPLKHTNPRCISGQYLMFDKTYLTSSSGHNESGETMGSVRHYVSDVYGSEEWLSATQDCASSANSFEKGFDSSFSGVHPGQDSWYQGVLSQLNRSYFSKRPDHVNINHVAEFLELINNTVITEKESSGLADELSKKLHAVSSMSSATIVNTKSGSATSSANIVSTNFSNCNMEHSGNVGGNSRGSANKVDEVNDVDGSFTGVIGPADATIPSHANADLDSSTVVDNSNSDHTAVTRSSTGNTSGFDGGDEVIYCPLKLSSAYSVDDGFNCEPAFTAFHGWQKGCVDYICYNPDHTLLEGIYEMPLYTQVRQNGDLPHKKWPASDHFSLISQFKRIK